VVTHAAQRQEAGLASHGGLVRRVGEEHRLLGADAVESTQACAAAPSTAVT
jgi:hypothetical protein